MSDVQCEQHGGTIRNTDHEWVSWRVSRPLSRSELNDAEAKFWGRVDMSGDCWIWTGRINERGYGVCTIRPTIVQKYAHRVAYVLAHGDLPAAITVDHLCENTRCVNPSHLEAVTKRENTRRRLDRNDQCRRGHIFDQLIVHKGQLERRCSECYRINARRRAALRRQESANG